MLLEDLLPHLLELSPVWQGMEEKDYVTSYVAINGIYHCVRNAFRSPDTLKRHVQDYIEENVESEEIQQVILPKLNAPKLNQGKNESGSKPSNKG